MIDLSSYVSSATKTIGGYTYTLFLDGNGNAIIEKNEGSASINMYCMMASPNTVETILNTPIVEPATNSQITTAIEAFWTGSIATYTYSLLFEL